MYTNIEIANAKKDLMINELVNQKDPNKCVRILQSINKKLLTEYLICVGDYVIEPLLVEAYYRNEQNFKDSNVHGKDGQKNRFGKLYFHETGRGGIDICLSDGEYHLSFLIKNSLVTNNGLTEFTRQTQLHKKLKEYQGTDNIVLKKRTEPKNAIVFNAPRKNLVKNDEFRKKELASVTGFELRDNNGKPYKFDLETGFGKETLITKYIQKHPKEYTKDEFKKMFLNYIPKKIKDYIS